MIDDQQAWAAFEARDRNADGRFVVGVTSTGIYCRPSCPARRPRRENVRFHADVAAARASGLRACRRCLPDDVARDTAGVERARALIEAEGGPLPLDQLGTATGYSPTHLQRLFTRAHGVSPAAYGRALRLEQARTTLREGGKVTDAIYDAGYSAPSRFYADAAPTGILPSREARGGAGMIIRWAIVPSRFGPLLIAATERGLCRISFDPDAERLSRDFPKATLVEDAEAPLIRAALAAIADPALAKTIPTDVTGTTFQQRVWAELRKIPPGETRSYLDIARAIGDPKATRAVGTANGANPVAIIVPCHRVIQSGGGLGGYAGGLERKKALLEAETAGGQGSLPLSS